LVLKEPKERKDHKVLREAKVLRVLLGLKEAKVQSELKVIQDLLVLKELKDRKDHKVLKEVKELRVL
jgi:hypothetical protein